MAKKGLGPGLLITAAFIGPGTVTTATLAGTKFGTLLVWAVLFSTVMTVLMQNMAARVGLVTGKGLGEALQQMFPAGWQRWLVVALVVSALGLGNAAFQTGNLSGAAIALELLTGTSWQLWAVALWLMVLALFFIGAYQSIQAVLVVLVALMSLCFIATSLFVPPAPASLASGLAPLPIPDGALVVVLGLIGTTVVPYNLFLHASAVQERWPAGEQPLGQSLTQSAWDSFWAICLGGWITLAILLTAAGTLHAKGITLETPLDLARQLEPLLGSLAKVMFALGLFAAGFTSAVTAPLAAAYAFAGLFGWPRDLQDWRLRSVWISVATAGLVMALVWTKPIHAILFAQAANGLLLPVIAFFLMVVANSPTLMGEYRNRLPGNLAGGLVILVCVLIGGLNILRGFRVL